MEVLIMPKTIEELYNQYGFRDYLEIYSNGTQYIPLFRIKQWLEMNGYDKAIDKQTSIPPEVTNEGTVTRCPSCGAIALQITYEIKVSYCSRCGQAINYEGI